MIQLVRVHVLSDWRIEDDDGRPIRLKTRKAMELVAWLVVHEGGGQRLQIAKDLWPQDPAELASSYLRQHLYFARRAVGTEAILSMGDGLKLNPELVNSDWQDLRSEIRSGNPPAASTVRESPAPRDVGPWWAEARDRIQAEIDQAGTTPEKEKESTPLGRVRRKWEFALFAVPIVALVMFPAMRRPNDQSLASLDDLGARLEAVDARLERSPNSEDDLREQAVLIRSFSARCWQKMWGREEPAVVSFCRGHVADVRSAVAWSLGNDPRLALQIVGDGHRIFDQCMPTELWAGWVDQALAKDPHTDPIARGRALCGVPLAHWLDDPKRSYTAATEAVQIFRDQGDRWDEANALRHQGFSLEAQTLPGTPLLLEARRIFEQIEPPDDQRGLAMTWESLAERTGKESPDRITGARELISDWYEASKRFRLLGNERLAILCLRAMAHEVNRLGRIGGPIKDWRFCRTELAFWASQKRSELEAPAALELFKACIEGDVAINDIPALTTDLMDLLHQRADRQHNRGAQAFLLGALLTLRSREGHKETIYTLTEDTFRPKTPPEKAMFHEGLSATPKQILAATQDFDKASL